MKPFSVLLLGGTAEAYALADRLAEARPAWRVVTSLAGRTKAPRKPKGELRVGGYGGPNLLAAFLTAEDFDVVVDATHPYAARIAANAAAACGVADRPRLKLLRPAFDSPAAAKALRAPSLAAAASLPPSGARVFLALGAGGAQAFAARPDLKVFCRTREPVKLHEKGAPPWRYIVGPPSDDIAVETAMLLEARAEWLVARDSGGDGQAKLTAADELGVKAILIDRPSAPTGPQVGSVAAAASWLDVQAAQTARRVGPRLVQPQTAAIGAA